jgi:pimeloyl-ACP methyl ester carboxylesterase
LRHSAAGTLEIARRLHPAAWNSRQLQESKAVPVRFCKRLKQPGPPFRPNGDSERQSAFASNLILGEAAMAVFVLVHGAWHEGSTWDVVVRHLESKGHKAFAPTAAGHGKGANKNVTHAQCVHSIVEFITRNSLSDIILLGHSFGGTLISKVAEAIPDKIRRLVFQNAFVLRDGNSLLDEIPPETAEIFAHLAQQSPDNTVMLPFPVWRENFINDADLDTARKAYETLSPEPYRPFADKLDLKKFHTLQIPRSYLNCTEDIALPPGEYGWHPRMSNRLGLYRLVQMPGSHEVLFTNPIGLAEKIVEAGRD